MQCDDGVVPHQSTCALGLAWTNRRRQPQRPWLSWAGSLHTGGLHTCAQCSSMSMEDTFKGLTAVAREMKSVGNLHRVRCSPAGAIGVLAGAIATDEFWGFALAEPVTQTIGRTIRQEVHHSAGVNVHQYRAEPVTTVQREIIDAQYSW